MRDERLRALGQMARGIARTILTCEIAHRYTLTRCWKAQNLQVRTRPTSRYQRAILYGASTRVSRTMRKFYRQQEER